MKQRNRRSTNRRKPSPPKNSGPKNATKNEKAISQKERVTEMDVKLTEETPEEPCESAIVVSNVNEEDLKNSENSSAKLFLTVSDKTKKEEPEATKRPKVSKESKQSAVIAYEAAVVESKSVEQIEVEQVKDVVGTQEPVVKTVVVKSDVINFGKETIEKETKTEGISDENSESEDASQRNIHVTNFYWERKDEDYNVNHTIFVKAYNRKFAAVLQFIDPEFRFLADIGPCETFDSEGVQKLLCKAKHLECTNLWPFNECFKATQEEIRVFLSEVLSHMKFCLKLACAERGYHYMGGQLKSKKSISSVWGDEIDPLLELKTLKALFEEMRAALIRNKDCEARFISEAEKILDVILPALENLDSKTLGENSISDYMSTVRGRKELGFPVTEEEVNEMLEQSFKEDGFGEFPSTALYAPTLFTSANQLKLIFAQLEKMSRVTDIRVKRAGIQAIARILEQLKKDERDDLLEELRDEPKIAIEKIFGFSPANFEVNKFEPKRAHYFKMIFMALGENNPKEEFFISRTRMSCCLMCFYLVFPAFEVNSVLFKILSTKVANNVSPTFETDRKSLLESLLMLPERLLKVLKIGPENEPQDITKDTIEDKGSMYFQVVNVICGGHRDTIWENLSHFLTVATAKHKHIISVEKSMRIAMYCVDKGVNRMMAVEMLRLLPIRRSLIRNLPEEFFEDLLIFALSQYSVPQSNTSSKKYEFIEVIIDFMGELKNNGTVHFDEKKVARRWGDLAHPFFSILFLAHRFSWLKSCFPVVQYPWTSEKVWNENDGNYDSSAPNKYIHLAKIPISWPNLSDLDCVETAVSELVPPEVSRVDLYRGMEKLVTQFSIDDRWKEILSKRFHDKVNFLTSHKKINEGISKIEQELTINEELEKEKSAEPIVEKNSDTDVTSDDVDEKKESPKVEEKKSLSLPIVDALMERQEKEEENVEKIDGNMQDGKAYDEKDNFDNKKTEETQKAGDIESQNDSLCAKSDENKNKLEPLSALPEDCFYGYYSEKEWNSMNDKVIREVLRQRKKHGYSYKT